MSKLHIGDAEAEFRVINITPDFCDVDGDVVPYEIYQELSSEKDYAKSVLARGERVLKRWSSIRGVIGNAGSGVLSTVSQGGGDTMMIEGAGKVFVEGEPVCRHLDLCLMNGG